MCQNGTVYSPEMKKPVPNKPKPNSPVIASPSSESQLIQKLQQSLEYHTKEISYLSQKIEKQDQDIQDMKDSLLALLAIYKEIQEFKVKVFKDPPNIDDKYKPKDND